MQQARSKSVLTLQACTIQLTSEVKVVNEYTLTLHKRLFWLLLKQISLLALSQEVLIVEQSSSAVAARDGGILF